MSAIISAARNATCVLRRTSGREMRETKNVERSQNVIENKGREKAVFAYPRMFMKKKQLGVGHYG
jgi:hypothetical protein